MADVGSESNPLRVAIIGSGPAGFYTVSNFARHKDLSVEVDMYDRLATPFGLVRGGVAPDHQKDKSVTRAYDKSAQKPNFRFYGNVAYGDDVTLDDLKAHYHQVIFTSGAPNDRNLAIPGEDLAGSHSATEFVAWYNGHPDFASRDFDLSQKSVAVIGIGNVAVDVARILCRTDEELRATDMADYAIDALRDSSVEDVYMFGRRGPAQAETQCFATLPEFPPSSNSDRRGRTTDRPMIGSHAHALTERNDRPTRIGSSPSNDNVRMGRA